MSSFRDFFLGKPERNQTFSNLSGGSQNLLNQLTGQLGGATTMGIEHLLRMLSGSPESQEAFQRPQMRQFQEEIIPQLAEGFGGMGAGSSSGAQQTFARAGERLQENLASQQGQSQQQAMNNLMQLLGLGLSPTQQNVIRPETHGFLGGLGQGAGGFLGNLPFMFR